MRDSLHKAAHKNYALVVQELCPDRNKSELIKSKMTRTNIEAKKLMKGSEMRKKSEDELIEEGIDLLEGLSESIRVPKKSRQKGRKE